MFSHRCVLEVVKKKKERKEKKKKCMTSDYLMSTALNCSPSCCYRGGVVPSAKHNFVFGTALSLAVHAAKQTFWLAA